MIYLRSAVTALMTAFVILQLFAAFVKGDGSVGFEGETSDNVVEGKTCGNDHDDGTEYFMANLFLQLLPLRKFITSLVACFLGTLATLKMESWPTKFAMAVFFLFVLVDELPYGWGVELKRWIEPSAEFLKRNLVSTIQVMAREGWVTFKEVEINGDAAFIIGMVLGTVLAIRSAYSGVGGDGDDEDEDDEGSTSSTSSCTDSRSSAISEQFDIAMLSQFKRSCFILGILFAIFIQASTFGAGFLVNLPLVPGSLDHNMDAVYPLVWGILSATVTCGVMMTFQSFVEISFNLIFGRVFAYNPAKHDQVQVSDALLWYFAKYFCLGFLVSATLAWVAMSFTMGMPIGMGITIAVPIFWFLSFFVVFMTKDAPNKSQKLQDAGAMQKEIAHLKEELAKKEEDNFKLGSNMEKLIQDAGAIQKEIEQLKEELAEKEEKNVKLGSDMERVIQGAGAMQKEIAQLKEELAKKGKENVKIVSNMKKLKAYTRTALVKAQDKYLEAFQDCKANLREQQDMIDALEVESTN